MISDAELTAIRQPSVAVMPLHLWAQYFSLLLGRPIKEAEALDAIKRMNAKEKAGPLTGPGPL